MLNRIRDGVAILRDIYKILGKRTALISLCSIFLSLFQFLVELSLAISLQAFFYVLGLVQDRPEYLADYIPYDNVTAVLSLFLVIGTLRALFTWLQSWVTGVVVVDCEAEIRRLIVDYSLNNRQAQSGVVADLFNDKAIGASNFVSSSLNILSRLTVSGLVLVSLFGISPMITVITLSGLFFLTLPIRFLNIRIRKHSDSLHRDIASTLTRLLSGIRNSLLLHIYGTKDKETALAQQSLSSYQYAYGSYFALSGFKGILPALFGVWLICLIAVTSKEIDPLAPALLVSYLYLFLRFVTSLGELANLGSYLSLTSPRANIVCQWWRENFQNITVSEKQTDKVSSSLLSESDIFKTIFYRPTGWRLKDVSLSYNSGDAPILDGVNLLVESGKCLALVGESGSGKSSLLALLLGLNQPTGGEVLVCTLEGEEYPLQDVKQGMFNVVGYVGPESFLIAGTIRDNLLYGIGDHSDDELIVALKMAECEFVFAFTDQLDHVITEQGEGISAGQKQRLALARALVRQPKLLILDEATANLDEATESRLKDTLATLKGTMTICLVTHRKTLLEIADETIYLQRSA